MRARPIDTRASAAASRKSKGAAGDALDERELLTRMGAALASLVSATWDAELASANSDTRQIALKRRRQSAMRQAQKVVKQYEAWVGADASKQT